MDPLRCLLPVLLLSIVVDRSGAQLVVDCGSPSLTITNPLAVCGAGNRGKIVNAGSKSVFNCHGASLLEYDARLPGNFSSLSWCDVGSIKIGGHASQGGGAIFNVTSSQIIVYLPTSVELRRSSTDILYIVGVRPNISLDSDSTAGKISIGDTAGMVLSYSGHGRTLAIVNEGSACLIARFPAKSQICVMGNKCMYNGSMFNGCLNSGDEPTPAPTPIPTSIPTPAPTAPPRSPTPSLSPSRTRADQSRTSSNTQSRTPTNVPTYTASQAPPAILTQSTTQTQSSSQTQTQSSTRTPTSTRTVHPPILPPPTARQPTITPSTERTQTRVPVAAVPADPQKPVALPAALTTTSETTAAVVSVVSPGSASQAARANSAMSMIRCEINTQEQPSYLDYPIQDYLNRSFQVTLLIVAGINAALQAVAAFCYRTGRHYKLIEFGVPLLLCFQVPNFARDAAVHWDSSSTMILAAGLMSASLLFPTAMVLIRPPTVADVIEGGVRRSGGSEIPKEALYGSFENVGPQPYVETFGEYVGPLRSHGRLTIRVALILEVWLGAVCSVLEGSRTDENSCTRFSYAILGLSLVFAVYQLGLAPLAPFFEKRSAQAKSVAQTVLAGMATVALYDDGMEPLVGYISVVLFGYMPIEFVVALLLDRRAQRLKKAFMDERKDSRDPKEVGLLQASADSMGFNSGPPSAQPHDSESAVFAENSAQSTPLHRFSSKKINPLVV
jgi:hypothetical protein